MARFKKNFWNGEGAEPVDYATERDPLHGFNGDNFGVNRDFTDKIVSVLKKWMDNQNTPFDACLNALRSEWAKQGGSKAIFDRMLTDAFHRSGYYKRMLKG